MNCKLQSSPSRIPCECIMEAKEKDIQLMQSWREVQHQISSHVTIPKDASKLSYQVITNNHHGRFRTVHPPHSSINSSSILIGGLDISYFGEQGTMATHTDKAIAVYVILKYATAASSVVPQEVVHRSHKYCTLPFPYIPSYLAFREVEPMIELVYSQIESHPEFTPHVLLVDGNGQWHERKAGIASFVGVKTGIPTIGVGKSFYSIDGVLKKEEVRRDVRMAMREWYDAMELMEGEKDGYERNDDDEPLSKRSLQQQCTLILDTVTIPHDSSLNNKEGSVIQDVPVDDIILTSLSRFAHGIAIPMKGAVKSSNDSEEILAYALVGHGGKTPLLFRNKQSNAATMKGGSKIPIYISVGSNIALIDAVALCAQLCITRIPEPIREADLYGRKLVRERQEQLQHQRQRQLQE